MWTRIDNIWYILFCREWPCNKLKTCTLNIWWVIDLYIFFLKLKSIIVNWESLLFVKSPRLHSILHSTREHMYVFVCFICLFVCLPCSGGWSYFRGCSGLSHAASSSHTHQHIWPNNPLNSNLSVWSIIIMFYYGHLWRYNSQIGTRSTDDSEGEGCPLPSSSARSLLKSQWPYMQETRPWNGQRHRGSGELEHALLAHCIMGQQDPH